MSRPPPFKKNGAGGGTSALYYKIDGGGYYADDLCAEQAYDITPPTRSGYIFKGYFSSASNGTKYIDRFGSFLPDFNALTLTAAKTIYARWVAPYKITISANSGTGGTTAFYFDSVSGRFYTATDLAEEISAITPHKRECFAFGGCHASNNTTSAQRIAPDGTIAADWTPTAAATIYAQWARVSWKVTLDKSNSTGGTWCLVVLQNSSVIDI